MGSPLAFRDAFAYVYSRRGCVTPYESFLRQLGELEPILKANADIEKADVGGTVVERYILFSAAMPIGAISCLHATPKRPISL